MDGMNWRRLIAVGGIASLGFVAACSDDDDPDGGTTTDTGTNPDAGFPADTGPSDTGPADSGETPDAGFIKVNFTIDDSANRVYDEAAGLAWKGSFAFDSTTRILTKTGWTGPFAKVWDDGPVSAGGHEPEGSTAADNLWGVEVLVAKPAAAEMFEYGAISGSTAGSDGNWIWSGPNGTFTIPADSNASITAAPLVLPPFGTVDFKLEINTSTLSPEFRDFDPVNGITVKGSAWAWVERECVDDATKGDTAAADGIYTFRLSDYVGPGSPLPYSGLLRTADEPEFVFVLGGVEYKAAGSALAGGVTAYVRAQGANDWTPVTIGNKAASMNNTYIVVP